MGVIDDRWRRVELVPMDPHCSDISIALYRAEEADGPVGLVHTYSTTSEARARVGSLARALQVLGGLEPVGEQPGCVRFVCRTWHALAAKRLFLEAAKHDPVQPLDTRALDVPDTRTAQTIRIEPLGAGRYAVRADGATDEVPSRAPAIAAALAKLAELELAGDEVVVFHCGHEHDALVALMLTRAQNLRAVLREEEMKASRGVLVAPSAQQ